jgi:hypothetical protein
MKAALIVLSLLLPLSSFAAFNPNSAYECQAEDGTKLLLNNEFSGPGKALVSGKGALYAVSAYDPDSHALAVALSSGPRALAKALSLRLNLAQEEITVRKEGAELVQYVYVPATLETTNLWKGGAELPAKCIQPL